MDRKLHNPTLRVLNILEAVYGHEEGLTFAELSRKTGILKGTLHPILMTLIETEYLQSSDSRVRIGKNCLKIGSAYANSLSYLKIIRPHMKEIVEACNEICQLGILDGTDVLYVAKMEPDQAIRVNSSVGTTIGAHATSLGKALLSAFDDAQVRALYPRKLERYTKNTVSSLPALLEQLAEVRKCGYALEKGEVNIDIECFSVPINVAKGVVAMSISLPLYRVTPEKTKEIINALQMHKKLVEKQLSLLPPDLEMFSLDEDV